MIMDIAAAETFDDRLYLWPTDGNILCQEFGQFAHALRLFVASKLPIDCGTAREINVCLGKYSFIENTRLHVDHTQWGKFVAVHSDDARLSPFEEVTSIHFVDMDSEQLSGGRDSIRVEVDNF